MNVALIPPVLCLALVFLLALRRYRRDRLHPALWVTALYFGSTAGAFIVSPSVLSRLGLGVGVDDAYTLTAYGFAIAALLVPLFIMRRVSVNRINYGVIESALKISAPLVLFSAIYLAPIAVSTTMLGADVVRHGAEGRAPLLPETMWTTIAVVVAQFYALYAFAFILTLINGASPWLRAIAFIGSTLYILNALVYTARDGILWFLAAYAWAIWYCLPLLTPQLKQRLRRVVVPTAVIGLALFVLFTVQRFSDRSDGSAMDYAVLYYSAQPYTFATTVREQDSFYHGKLRLPLLTSMLGQNSEVVRTQRWEWSFGTIVKDIYSEGGWFAVAYAALLVPVVFICFLAMARSSPTGYMILSLLYVQIMAQGVFYWRMGNRVGNLYTFVLLALALLLTLGMRLRPRQPRLPA